MMRTNFKESNIKVKRNETLLFKMVQRRQFHECLTGSFSEINSFLPNFLLNHCIYVHGEKRKPRVSTKNLLHILSIAQSFFRMRKKVVLLNTPVVKIKFTLMLLFTCLSGVLICLKTNYV